MAEVVEIEYLSYFTNNHYRGRHASEDWILVLGM